MKIFNLFYILLILSTFKAHSFDKDFTIISDKTPYEFNVMFNSLKGNLKTLNEQIKLIGVTEDLNRNLGFLDKDHIYLLMKSEVTKTVLEYQFEKTRQFDINSGLISTLEQRFNQQERYLNDFSKWIWRSIIGELKFRQNAGIISSKSFNPTLFDGEKKTQAVRFQRYLRYLMPWIDQMENLEHQKFNELSLKISWEILRKLNDRSLLFKTMSFSQADAPTTLFNIPEKLRNLSPDKVKEMIFLEESTPLSDQQNLEKSEAQDQMNQITPSDLSPLSDEISKKIETESP